MKITAKVLALIWIVVIIVHIGWSPFHLFLAPVVLLSAGRAVVDLLFWFSLRKKVVVSIAKWREYRNGAWGSEYTGIYLQRQGLVVAKLSHGLRAWKFNEKTFQLSPIGQVAVEARFVESAKSFAQLNHQFGNNWTVYFTEIMNQ